MRPARGTAVDHKSQSQSPSSQSHKELHAHQNTEWPFQYKNPRPVNKSVGRLPESLPTQRETPNYPTWKSSYSKSKMASQTVLQYAKRWSTQTIEKWPLLHATHWAPF